MAFYGNTPTATASVSANTNLVTITGIDLSLVTPGMTINFGSRDGAEGKAWLIGSVSPTGSSGGTLTTQGSIPTTYSNVPFLINTTGYLGTDASYAAAVGLAILNTLSTLFGAATNLYSGARQIEMGKVAASAVSRFVFSIAGRAWSAIEHRTLSFTPTGGQAQSIETLAVRAAPDGTTWVDALLIDLTNGTGDLRKASASMVSAATVDLSSAPVGKVAITGSATINSFGPGKHLERLVHIVDGGATLVHNATSLILLGGANIVTRAGDCFHVTSDGSGNWRMRSYARADGSGGFVRLSATAAALLQGGNFASGLLSGTGITGKGVIADGPSGIYGRVQAYNFDNMVNMVLGLNPGGGNVGVGTAGPLATLHVAGTTYLQGGSFYAGQFGASMIGNIGGTLIDAPGGAYGRVIGFNPGTGVAIDMQIGANGRNVGIGTNASTTALGVAGTIAHSADNTWAFGTPSLRATAVYAASSTINTSDAREKTEVASLSEAEIGWAQDLAREIGSFRFLAAIEAKGEDARRHIGMTVQRAIQLGQARGLDPFAYAFICHDAWDATPDRPAIEPTPEIRDEETGDLISPATDGIPARPGMPAGDRYGFRTDQLALFIARGQEARLAAIEAHLERSA